MNAGGVSKACKSNGPAARQDSGKRVSNTLVIYREEEYNSSKDGLILHVI